MEQHSRILVRATNWIGDAVMSLPALRALRARFPDARISVLAKPWVAGLYARERFADEVLHYNAPPGTAGLAAKWNAASELRRHRFDAVLLLPNSFESAAVAFLARIPHRYGYARDGRSLLLTRSIPAPGKGEIPRHESFYYLELLRRLGWIDSLPAEITIRLDGAPDAARDGAAIFARQQITGPVIGVSPGAAYGSAKRWLPERFAQCACDIAAHTGATVALFGSSDENSLCESVRDSIEAAGIPARNFAGQTSLPDFISMAAACRLFLTNDSGAMHIASALGIPIVTVFGATDHIATGPTGPLSRIVREPVDCSPCLLRECPIDHRCMTRVSAEQVTRTALDLLS